MLVRLEWNDFGNFENNASLVVINRKLPVPNYRKKKIDGWIVIETDSLNVKYREGTGKFSPENLLIEFRLNGKKERWFPGLSEAQNLGGTARTLDGCVGGLNWEGKQIDLGNGILSRDGWTLIDDSRSQLFDGSDWNWVIKRPDQNGQDWYFFGYGHHYKQALYDYTRIAGKIPLIPKFALGYWWSRYWVYSDQELKDLMSEFKSFNIPMDVLIIDMDWHETFGGLRDPHNPLIDETGHWVGWTGYTWNRTLFPDPKKFLEWTDRNALKTALNLHPASGIAPMEEQYDSFAKEFGFDTSGRHYIDFAMENRKWAKTYFNTILQPMERQGIDFWWLDWQQYQESKSIKGLSNTWWLNYTFYTDMQQRKVKRPLVFHRWGGLGNHRYPIGFSGDDRIDWRSLKYQTYFTATASNVGYGYWSHDIGGHASSMYDSDPELYVRWLQFGVFSPILRTHSAKISSIERRFWKYPNHFGIMKDLIDLRYSLAPYIYTANRQAFDTGISLCRPMYYDYPEQNESYEYRYQYMFGENILVAPIADSSSITTRLSSKTLWLPEGKWYEWHSGTLVSGGKTIIRNFAIDEIPLYVKAGSIIPLYPKIPNLQSPVSSLILAIVPGGGAMTEVYDDDGNTEFYKQGEYSKTKIVTTEQGPGELKISIFPAVGGYAGMPESKQFEIRLLRSFPPAKVIVNGKEFLYSTDTQEGKWSYYGKNLTTNISIPPTSIRKKIEVTVVYDKSMTEKEFLLDDKLVKFRRLSKVLAEMKIEVARQNWWAVLPNAALAADQIPVNIQYHPERIVPMLEEFEKQFPLMKNELLSHPDGRKDVVKRLINYLEL